MKVFARSMDTMFNHNPQFCFYTGLVLTLLSVIFWLIVFILDFAGVLNPTLAPSFEQLRVLTTNVTHPNHIKDPLIAALLPSGSVWYLLHAVIFVCAVCVVVYYFMVLVQLCNGLHERMVESQKKRRVNAIQKHAYMKLSVEDEEHAKIADSARNDDIKTLSTYVLVQRMWIFPALIYCMLAVGELLLAFGFIMGASIVATFLFLTGILFLWTLSVEALTAPQKEPKGIHFFFFILSFLNAAIVASVGFLAMIILWVATASITKQTSGNSSIFAVVLVLIVLLNVLLLLFTSYRYGNTDAKYLLEISDEFRLQALLFGYNSVSMVYFLDLGINAASSTEIALTLTSAEIQQLSGIVWTAIGLSIACLIVFFIFVYHPRHLSKHIHFMHMTPPTPRNIKGKKAKTWLGGGKK